MAEGLKIEIVSPERLVLSETVVSVTVPGTEGYFTVMNDHAPFMTTLRPGFITVTKDAGHADIYFVKGGFADVSPSGLTILAERSIPFAHFDHGDLQTQIKAAEEELARAASPEDKSYAQEVVSGLLNLAIEAQQINGAHVH
ncbi:MULTISPECIES: F0F1 ATP synthase subunit epsilon [Devosia]|uniref:ATP synthase epsilon chain n=1 Tax=Devosia equisanguinis TaxID=2490941 RepID=A0A3S4DS02_9HYPH|nr:MULTISPECIES: F0F1 ATP synthase subunit epsilon [Devosia]ODT51335.1 MAG: ATP synthase F1 subunit epsilon [Pelagibacterium sp. SCN 63-126]ODU86626.1 MAG: ATP synthase F1 subunit epsilon [Pelagibacterium sp. SCN 63-17]OJX41799.1 MAG: ATP synthase F1 subunit epsilon [Devosia sp. 63-57]VDS05885.1 ATP synthase epsilon chain [Devosia equisanguinis]